jgi:hypothetical protein
MLSVVSSVEARPVVLTVPIVRPLLFVRLSEPTFPASVPMLLEVLLSVYAPPPSSSSPAALIGCVCVIAPAPTSNVTLPVAVIPFAAYPPTETAPMESGALLVRLKEPPTMDARMPTSLVALGSEYVPVPHSRSPLARILPPVWLVPIVCIARFPVKMISAAIPEG